MATLSNGQLAQRVNDVVVFIQSRHGQLDEWMNGVVDGGDFSNGTYPLTDYLGETIYVRCPAQLEQEVNGLTGSASSAQTAAEAAQVQAALSAAASLSSESNATILRDAAVAAQAAAEIAKDTSVNASVNAIAQKQAAKLYSERAFELVDALGALGSHSLDYGSITDFIVSIFTDGTDFGLIALPIVSGANLGLISQPHNQSQNLGYL